MSKIIKVYKPREMMEGAGVEVNRVFGYYQVTDFDPFLMLDYFESEGSDDSPGFPWHPHKGIETITYMLRGSVKHEDSLGHAGIIGAGDLQWMTAGSGIYHQEMPQSSDLGYKGFQFWLNMPAHHKLDKPKYQELTCNKLVRISKNGAEIFLISGEFEGKSGPFDKTSLGVLMMHVKLEPKSEINLIRAQKKKGFVYVFEGDGYLGEKRLLEHFAYTLSEGEATYRTNDKSMEFIFAEGIPINEPIAWYGPMVMNTQAEIQQALQDLKDGTFI
jgi:redox-sensitive bicupin YhaK (pirin superfamily)